MEVTGHMGVGVKSAGSRSQEDIICSLFDSRRFALPPASFPGYQEIISVVGNN